MCCIVDVDYLPTSTQVDRMLMKEEVDQAFTRIIRLVKEDSEAKEAPKESMTTVKPKWDQALLS